MIKLFEQFNNEQEIIDICREYGIKNYTINPDGSVDVDDYVNLCNSHIEKLPIKFNKVKSYFDVSNSGLKTLEGFPKEVGHDILIYRNQLTNLFGLPEKTNHIIHCGYNQLTSLEGCPLEVEGLYCNNNMITTLKGGPMVINGDFDLRNNPISIIDSSISITRDIALKGTNFDDKIKELSQEKLRILFEHGVDYNIFGKDGVFHVNRLERMFKDFNI